MSRIAALAVAGVLATAVSAGAAPDRSAADGAGPQPPKPTAPPGAALDGEAWAWTQLTSRGTQIRYVSTDSSQSCPTVRYTLGTARNPFQMHRVSTPMGSQFPTTVCELTVPLTATDAVLEQTTVRAATLHPANRQLPLPRWTPTTRPGRIGVIGDTGCSLPVTGPAQNCATGWPFGRIATSLANGNPDLVIHVGDYLYREDPNRANDKPANPGCRTSADAASWDCLVADFFRPAEALLAKAPVVLVRGNHEDCNLAGQGGAGGAWFRYLADDLRSNGSCSNFTPPAFLRAGTLNLVSVDSSLADPGDNGNMANRNLFTNQFEAVNRDAGLPQHATQDYFVLTHKPLWMVKQAGFAPGNVTWATPVLDSAVANTSLHALRENVRLVLSGHIHIYQMLDFDTARPPQLTVGSSGAPLDNGPNDANVVGKMFGRLPQPVHQSITQEQNPPGGIGVFGYAELLDTGSTWTLVFRDTNGSVRGQTCTLSTSTANKSFTCV